MTQIQYTIVKCKLRTIVLSQVRAATKLWDKSGTFIFTSSTGVNNVPEGGTLTEDTPLHPAGTSDRVDRWASFCLFCILVKRTAPHPHCCETG